MIRACAVLAIGAGSLLVLPAAAEESLPPLSFGFAHHAGSGIYNVEERLVQIYGLPFSVPVQRLEDHAWGLGISLPVTFGFFDFKPSDVIAGGLPENVGTLSLVPALRFELQATDRWLIAPFVEWGAAKDFEGGDLVYVSGLGVDSEIGFSCAGLPAVFVNRILAAASRVHDSGEEDSYGELRSGFEIRWPPGFAIRGHETDLGMFVANYLYFKPPEVMPVRLLDEADTGESPWLQWELGVTFGARSPAKWWKIPLPRIGLGYRFGDGPQSVRIVFGRPF